MSDVDKFLADKALQEAQERTDTGWDRDQARAVLAESIATIKAASHLARVAVEGMGDTAHQMAADVQFLHDAVEAMKDSGLTSAREARTLTRSVARDILISLRRLQAAFDVQGVVKLSLDLTRQSSMFVAMMEQIDRRYGREDGEKQADITQSLTLEQLMIVNGWLAQAGERANLAQAGEVTRLAEAGERASPAENGALPDGRTGV